MLFPIEISRNNYMSSQNDKYKSAGPSPSHNFTCNSRSRNIKDYRSSLSKYLKANPANLRFNNKANFDFWQKSQMETQQPRARKLPTVVDSHSPSSTDFDTVFHSFQKITSLVDRISKNSQKPFGGQLKGPKISLQKELEKFRHEESTRSGISMTGFRNKIKNLQEEKKHRDLFNEPDRLL